MRRTALAVFLIGSTGAWGQVQNETPGSSEKVDRATAYYHYMLAHMYAEKAAASVGRNKEYIRKANENYKAAIKADPKAPMLSEEQAKALRGRFSPPVLRSPAGRPSR
jgi:hypothetical protein